MLYLYKVCFFIRVQIGKLVPLLIFTSSKLIGTRFSIALATCKQIKQQGILSSCMLTRYVDGYWIRETRISNVSPVYVCMLCITYSSFLALVQFSFVFLDLRRRFLILSPVVETLFFFFFSYA